MRLHMPFGSSAASCDSGTSALVFMAMNSGFPIGLGISVFVLVVALTACPREGVLLGPAVRPRRAFFIRSCRRAFEE